MRRITWILVTGLCAAGWACGGGGAAREQDIAKALSSKPEEKKDEGPPLPPPEKQLELPWTFEEVRDAMRGGATLVYAQTGKDAKGKAVEDDYKCEIRKSTETEVGTVCDGVRHPSKDKGATQVAMKAWSQYSPFFAVERVEKTLVGFEKVAVPAGEFATVHVQLAGFFGQRYDVWMVEDKPGLYAKVVVHPNAGEESDQTEMTFELASTGAGAAAGG
jgi:hypothetical protein